MYCCLHIHTILAIHSLARHAAQAPNEMGVSWSCVVCTAAVQTFHSPLRLGGLDLERDRFAAVVRQMQNALDGTQQQSTDQKATRVPGSKRGRAAAAAEEEEDRGGGGSEREQGRGGWGS